MGPARTTWRCARAGSRRPRRDRARHRSRAGARGQDSDRAGWRVRVSWTVLLEVDQVIVELVQPAFPEEALLGQPILRELHLFGHELVGADSAAFGGADEAAPFEDLEVLDERGKGHVKRLG